MRFKLDENLDVRLIPLLADGGHDVDTLHAETLLGSPDEVIYEASRTTGRTHITREMDELRSRSRQGMPWIVEPGRIRVYDAHEEPGA